MKEMKSFLDWVNEDYSDKYPKYKYVELTSSDVSDKLFEDFVSERKDTPKPKGAPDWHDSDAPDAEGRFKDLSPKELAKWLIKTRDGDLKRISGSLTQQIVFRRKRDPEYADKMEKTRIEVYKQLGRDDLLEK